MSAKFIRPGLVLAAVLLSACGQPEPEPPRRIFVVTIDTLRADHLGFYGYPRPTSPFLDQLAERSVVFESAHASCSHTGPSHASLFTGLQPAQHRLLENGQPLPPAVRTLAQTLADAGYATAGFSTVRFVEGLAAGFETMHTEPTYQPAPVIFGHALDHLRGRAPEEKVFVWVHLYDVHQWYNRKHLDDAARKVVVDAGPSRSDLMRYLVENRGLDVEGGKPRRRILQSVNQYDGQVLSTDRALESFFNTVRAEGLAEDDLWVITADHGEGLGSHGFMGHGMYIYNEQTRVPLLVHAGDGRFRSPRRVEGLFGLVDVAPTLAEIAGTSFDAAGELAVPLAGRSFLDVLRDPAATWEERPIYTQRRPVDEKRLDEGWAPGEVFALQDGALKVIVNTEGEHEVYDLAADPLELKNRIDDPPPGQERMLRDLVRMYRRMVEESAALGGGEIDPKYVEELKALGYL